MPFADALDVLDWRRRVNDLYRRVREDPDVERAHAHWRKGRDEMLRAHPASPVPEPDRLRFTGGTYGAYDPSLRFEARLDADVEPRVLDIATGTDGIVRFTRVAAVSLGDLGRLDVWWLAGYGGGLFVPVADAGADTYPGGRYVLDTAKGADLGSGVTASGASYLVVDLNFAYNPSCAYDPGWACPLAPEGNRIEAELHAGEQLPGLGPH